MSFSLAILLVEDHFPMKNMFVTTTIVIVMFTVFFQVTISSKDLNKCNGRFHTKYETPVNELVQVFLAFLVVHLDVKTDTRPIMSQDEL